MGVFAKAAQAAAMCALLWQETYSAPSPQFPAMQQEVKVEWCAGADVVLIRGRLFLEMPDGTQHQLSPWKELASQRISKEAGDGGRGTGDALP